MNKVTTKEKRKQTTEGFGVFIQKYENFTTTENN